MNIKFNACQNIRLVMMAVAALILTVHASPAEAMMVDGIMGTTFNLTAKADYISTPDGGSLYFWGYANGAGRAQYTGPTLILDQGDAITVNLTNELTDAPVSIVFPGHNVTAAGDQAGLITMEAAPAGGTASYTFVASNPGTYLYHSGTNPELQVEMGLVGAIVVRPAGFSMMAPTAYGHPDSAYDMEFLFILSEMDPRIHRKVECAGIAALAATDYVSDYFPNYWFINGRCAPDTMFAAGAPWLPTQPYNCMPMMHPGDKLLLRIIDAGRDLHPFHYHGNHARIIARDGRLLESAPGMGADLSHELFTGQAIPGETTDAIFTWTGQGLGWDIYGDPADPMYAHACVDGDNDGFDDATQEYCADHGKPFPVVLTDNLDLTFGGFWSGSPFMGGMDELPPGQGGLNPMGGYTYMWHSHTEKEMTNFDIFPGGMMTMLMILPPGAPLM